MEAIARARKHFVLVHGSCHGAWSWYKVKPRLESQGHKVTALDLSACGINSQGPDEIQSLNDYSLPLLEAMESIPPNDKVILVGHSFGGLSLALAMDKFPEKVLVAVFVAAFMPDTQHPSNYVIEKMHEELQPGKLMDTKYIVYGSTDKPRVSTLFGPKFLSSKVYQLCPPEDLALATMLIRPTPAFQEESFKAKYFSKEGYGSVKSAYIICNQDKTIPENLQRWQIANNGVAEVREIKDADHMPMLSKPQELCQCLLEIADKYSD